MAYTKSSAGFDFSVSIEEALNELKTISPEEFEDACIEMGYTPERKSVNFKYEPVDQSEAIKGCIEGHEYFYKESDGAYCLLTYQSNLEQFCRAFKKVEVDWKEEVMSFLNEEMTDLEHDEALVGSFTNEYLVDVHPDKFLEMCRVALRANGEIE